MDVGLEGFDDLEWQLKELDNVAQKKVLRSALRKSGAPVLSDVKNNAESQWGQQSGVTQESIKMRVKFPKNPKYADVIAEIGVFRIRGLEKISGEYMPAPIKAYWLEHGVQPHALGKGANVSSSKSQEAGLSHPGYEAKPVIRPSLDDNINQVLNTQKLELNKSITRAIKKKNR
ncbi:TPA: hypothetical protein ACX6NV_000568 [Photobacterium damselae]